MIYSLNIGGVKRWLALNKDSESGTVADTDKSEQEKKTQIIEPQAPWWTTSGLASRLLEPQVPSVEVKEYKRYYIFIML
jgi:phosphatidylinositol 3,5-bisphosphate 5-phosphatase